jgi:hypothetical protein
VLNNVSLSNAQKFFGAGDGECGIKFVSAGPETSNSM